MVLFPKVLKALVTQSLKEWDACFVVDGDFPEAAKEIHKAFKKSVNHYKVVELPNGGAQRARNEGFKRTDGEYVVLLDSDCVIEPHTAQAWVDQLDKNPQYGFVYSGYRFLDEKGAIPSEPFDPWMLRVRNYISMCFPFRRELFVPLNEDLESLQDWNFWLSLVEKGAIGKMLQGHAFSTAYPTPKSISGKGCTPEKWLERMDKVKLLHNIPIKEVCVTSLHNRLDGIALAKALDADYDDHPNDKPNHYKKIIQLGFSVKPGEFEQCTKAWGQQHSKVIFWTAEDVEFLFDGVSARALQEYSKRLNEVATSYVEDNAAKHIMTALGFAVTVLPLPVLSKQEVAPLPKEPKFLVDIAPDYGHCFIAIQKAIPDIQLEVAGGIQKIEDFTGMAVFYKDRLLRPSIKRMLASGRQLVSNVAQPFTGYLDDRVSDGVFVREFVEKIRATVKRQQNMEQVRYWTDRKRMDRLKEAIS